MSGNPLDVIVGFVFKIIFGFVIGFVGIFIMTMMIGNFGMGITFFVDKIFDSTATYVPFSIADTAYLLDQAFSFMEAWFPYAWYVFQWIIWLFMGSWTGWFPEPKFPGSV